eukprot:g6195.t1
MSSNVNVVLTSGDGSSFASALAERLESVGGGASEVRCSEVVDTLDGLTDVCRGADVVYLLSALELPDSPDKRRLRDFKAGVSRVLECCQTCGVGSLVFMSSSRVVSPSSRPQPQGPRRRSGRSSGAVDDGCVGVDGVHLCDENVPLVTSREDKAAHAIAVAETEVLKASETQNLGKGVLYTCALRPGIVYGKGRDEPLLRMLSWVGWGLNRVTLLGLQDTKSDMVYLQNLIDATVLAGTKLAEGAAAASGQAGGGGWGTGGGGAGPACSGQAYFVTDGRPCSLQCFVDDVLQGLDFPTSKVVWLPVCCALGFAWLAELMCKMKLTATPPVITRSEVRKLVQSRASSIERARTDLGYEPRVDNHTALRSLVEDLKRDGWGRHTFLVPGFVYWITIPPALYLTAIAAFAFLCPPFMEPVQHFSRYIHLAVFRRLWAIRLVFVSAVLAHMLEAWYAFSRAKRAGHGDTAPLWLIQTFILGFPSTRLVYTIEYRRDDTTKQASSFELQPPQYRIMAGIGHTRSDSRVATIGVSYTRGKPQLQRQQEQRRWSEERAEKAQPDLCRSANRRDLAGSDPFFFEKEQLPQQRQSPSSSSDPDFPLPWQGNIDLPASDEETMNAAQTWIAQILHETGEDANDDDATNSSSDVLLDGRVLCRVANAIAPGTVEVSNMCSFSIACRKFGVPAGALFDVADIDPRRVGLCLHVLSRVVRDTVPEFTGPFLTLPSVLSPTPTTDGGVPTRDFASLRQWPPPHDGAATPASEDEDGGAPHHYQQANEHHHHRQSRPPTPPPMRPRPLSFPSRFSPATQAEDAVWNSLFPPSASSAVGGGGGGGGDGEIGSLNLGTGGEGGDLDAAAAWRATGEARTPRYEFSERATAISAGTAAELSSWLSNLNLGSFEDSLINIGVESMGDLRSGSFCRTARNDRTEESEMERGHEGQSGPLETRRTRLTNENGP